MFNNVLKSLVFLLILGLVGCENDTETFVPNTNSNTTSTVDIFGVVVDVNNNPIQDATVSFQGTNVTTNEYGVYEFNDVIVNSRHNHLEVKKDGFFENTKTFRSPKDGNINLKSRLMTLSYNESISSSQGGNVEKGKVKLDFPQSAIVSAATNESYTGEVELAIQHLNPLDDNITDLMPGDLTALDSEGLYRTLVTFGMVAVELRSPDGEKLQVKNGEKVKMTIDIEPELVSQAPQEIKMWHFDHDQGLWIEEGLAQKVGNTYQTEVGHFSYWNYDFDLPSIILSGVITNESGDPLSNVHILVAADGFDWGGHGTTNSDGSFSGAVTKGEVLNVFLENKECPNSNWIKIAQIGPFEEDTDVGILSVEPLEITTINVSATFVDCDGNPVTSGFVKIQGRTYPFENGTFSQELIACNAGQVTELIVVDLVNLTSADPITLDFSQDVSLGNVSVCGEDAINHFQIKSDDINMDVLALHELLAMKNDSIKELFGYHYNSETDSMSVFIRLGYSDNSAEQFELGTYELDYGFVEINNNEDSIYDTESGQVTIQEVNLEKKFLKGLYNMVTIDNQGNNANFSGSFQLEILE